MEVVSTTTLLNIVISNDNEVNLGEGADMSARDANTYSTLGYKYGSMGSHVAKCECG